MDGLIAALGTPAERWPYHKAGFSPQAAAGYTSLWTIAGTPGAGVAPSSGVAGDVPTSATVGAIPFTNPGGGSFTYLTRLFDHSTVAGNLFLYDRLWHNSGLSVTTTGNQTVQASTPTVPLTRPDALGAQVEAWWDIYTVMGAGTSTITIVYTDQSGNLTQTGTLQGFAATAAAGRAFRFSLAAGDTGVRSIQTWQSSVSMTSGAMGLVLRRMIASAPLGLAGTGAAYDFAATGMPRIYDSACLELLWVGASSTTTIGGDIQLAQG